MCIEYQQRTYTYHLLAPVTVNARRYVWSGGEVTLIDGSRPVPEYNKEQGDWITSVTIKLVGKESK